MSATDDFYVGYLPISAGLRRRIGLTLIVLALTVVTAATALALLQRDPGDGRWDMDHLTQLEGTLALAPYPTLHVIRPFKTSVLLVGEGKVGVTRRLAGLDGKTVRLAGHVLRRGGLTLLELDDQPLSATQTPGENLPTESSSETRRFTGEIIDPKCFTGAMKPGDGKAHKACAILCIRGGIPPMFRDDAGDLLLLVNEAGRGLDGDELEAILPFVADHVELIGATARIGTIVQLRMRLDLIRRLSRRDAVREAIERGAP